MKSGMKSIVIGTISALALSSAALAGPGQLEFTDIDAWGQYAAGDARGGGPFEARPIGLGVIEGLGQQGAAAGTYLSFCVEINEYVGETTYNAVINTQAEDGGEGGPNPDPLDARTAFLFTAFLKGEIDDKLANAGLSTFTYGAGLSGIAMQEAIWVLEEEVSAGTVSALASDLVDLANAAVAVNGEWFGKGIGKVRILNLTHRYSGSNRQDQLVMIPLPIPAALGLIGLVGVGISSWRRRGAGSIA